MSKLPSYFERHLNEKEIAIPIFPFSNLKDDAEFQIADRRIKLTDFDPYTFSGFSMEDKTISYARMDRYPVLIPGFGGLIAGPKLHEFAEKSTDALEETTQIMENAYF